MKYSVNVGLPHKETADLFAELIIDGSFQSWLNAEMKEKKIAGELREYSERTDMDLNKPRQCVHHLTIKPLYGE
jgi:hypothetical protein